MAADSGSTRWWENYLVRYFLPSIAGMIIVAWLSQNTGSFLIKYVPIFSSNMKDFGAPHLFAWLLFGTLYCYVASYPCLVFHSTRVLDFKYVTGNVTRIWCNPYLTSIVFTVAAYLSLLSNNAVSIFIAVSIFAALQIIRIYLAYSIQGIYGFKLGEKNGNKYKTSIAYAYLSKLAKQRAIIELITETVAEEDQDKKSKPASNQKPSQNNSKNDEDEEEDKIITKSNHKRDLADSYRHLREHGNTAFIFLLEIALCPVMFTTLNQPTEFASAYYTAGILTIWILPSVFVHWLSQHLEHRYSLFKY